MTEHSSTTSTTTPTDRSEQTPDLTNYRQVHQAMRVSDDRLVAALGDRPRSRMNRTNATSLARWFTGYSGELRHHHRVEDEIFFPALADRVPAFAEYEATLSADHDHLDELIDAIQDTLERGSRSDRDWTSARPEALAHVIELRDLMNAHLDFEDTDILPLFERHFGYEEYAAIDAQALKGVSVRQACFTVPWWMATVEPEAAMKALSEAPTPLKVVYRLTRRRYARLVRRAFGPTGAAAKGGAS